MKRSARINSKILKYSIVLKAFGIIDQEEFQQIIGSSTNESDD
ncbi:hypothetical protein V7147_08260 [Bacillus sp. JJ1521]